MDHLSILHDPEQSPTEPNEEAMPKASTARPIPVLVKVATREKGGFETFCWFCSALGAFVGGAIVFFGMPIANSAPQETVVISFGIAVAVLPYCFARAVSEMAK